MSQPMECGLLWLETCRIGRDESAPARGSLRPALGYRLFWGCHTGTVDGFWAEEGQI